MAIMICRPLFRQYVPWAFCLLLDRAGSSSDARMPMMAITTSISTSVNAFFPDTLFVMIQRISHHMYMSAQLENRTKFRNNHFQNGLPFRLPDPVAIVFIVRNFARNTAIVFF